MIVSNESIGLTLLSKTGSEGKQASPKVKCLDLFMKFSGKVNKIRILIQIQK